MADEWARGGDSGVGRDGAAAVSGRGYRSRVLEISYGERCLPQEVRGDEEAYPPVGGAENERNGTAAVALAADHVYV